jgi:branched-chain amino acid transport system permease protein
LGVVAIAVVLLFPRGIWGELVERYNIRLLPVGYTVRQLAGKVTTRAADGDTSPR